jgi:ELWxxDGT repeat protein
VRLEGRAKHHCWRQPEKFQQTWPCAWYRRDGTANGTTCIGTDGSGTGLWRSDGTIGGTVEVKGFAALPSNLTAVDGTLNFTTHDGTNGSELWKSNGTALGTVMVKDIASGAG